MQKRHNHTSNSAKWAEFNRLIRKLNAPQNSSISDDKIREIALKLVVLVPIFLDKLEKKFQTDRTFIQDAVGRNPLVLCCLKPPFDTDEEIILSALEKKGELLRILNDEDRKKQRFVLSAVKQDGMALEFAPDIFKDNAYVVSKAVIENKKAIEFASPRIQHDPRLVGISNLSMQIWSGFMATLGFSAFALAIVVLTGGIALGAATLVTGTTIAAVGASLLAGSFGLFSKSRGHKPKPEATPKTTPTVTETLAATEVPAATARVS